MHPKRAGQEPASARMARGALLLRFLSDFPSQSDNSAALKKISKNLKKTIYICRS
jgi:hypothetical protein